MRVIMIPRAIEQDAGERYVGTVSRVKSDSTWCKLNELLSNYQYPSHYLHRRSKILIKLKSRWTSRIWKLWAGYPGVYFTKTTYFWLFSFFVYVLVRSVFHVTMWNVVLFLIIFFSTVMIQSSPHLRSFMKNSMRNTCCSTCEMAVQESYRHFFHSATCGILIDATLHVL